MSSRDRPELDRPSRRMASRRGDEQEGITYA
jgi:hypothetical protein